jgi:hypothetical protein
MTRAISTPHAAPIALTKRRTARGALRIALTSGRALGTGLAALLVLTIGTAGAQPRPAAAPVRVPLSIAVVQRDGAPVVSERWLTERIETANRIYAACGIEFVVAATRPLDARHADLVTRADRHALGAAMEPRVANVFVVASLRDVDAEGYRQGVHWRPARRPGAHFVIVSADSGPSTLAHELGHFFGNGHSSVRGNLMSYERGDGDPFFDAAQQRRIALFLARFLRTRELVPR